VSLAMKNGGSALNVSTFVSLHAYGYRNVYELGPSIDFPKTRLAFTGTEVRTSR
jgi:hypothetical protein